MRSRLGPDDGFSRVCVANLDTILTITKSSLQEYIATLTPQKLRAVESAIHFVLGMEE